MLVGGVIEKLHSREGSDTIVVFRGIEDGFDPWFLFSTLGITLFYDFGRIHMIVHTCEDLGTFLY
jgi:hypothetical protein